MRSWIALIVEVAGAVAVVTGVALISVPAAFIVGGILAIIGSEFSA
jgi:uncharacterized membrane protein